MRSTSLASSQVKQKVAAYRINSIEAKSTRSTSRKSKPSQIKKAENMKPNNKPKVKPGRAVGQVSSSQAKSNKVSKPKVKPSRTKKSRYTLSQHESRQDNEVKSAVVKASQRRSASQK